MSILEALKSQLSEGLIKRSANTGSRWAETYVELGKTIPGKLKFDSHPWSRIWHDLSNDWSGMKAAQMAMAQAALHRSLYTVDILKNDVLYLFPKKSPDATDFSKAKFDGLLDLSPYIARMFSNVRNVGHKQAGSVNLYLRGMKSRTGLKSISVGLMVFDEYDEMLKEAIALAEERSSGYQEKDKQVIKISTPSIPGKGIAEEILTTNQQHYFFHCPRCGVKTELLYPECLVITADDIYNETELKKSHLICKECKQLLPHESKRDWLKYGSRHAMWEPTVKGFDKDGFQINQMYSTVMEPWKIAKVAILARTSSSYEQELYNSKLGLPRTVEGARVTTEMLAACTGNHTVRATPPQNSLMTMGVDVGHKVLYYTIDQWLLPPQFGNDLNTYAIPKTVAVGLVPNFGALDALMRDYQINHVVVDVDPAFREALLFAQRYGGSVNLCRFARGVGPKNIRIGESKEAAEVIHANRTYWLDISQGRYKRGTRGIILPKDRPREYDTHLKNLVRHEHMNDEGNFVAKYINVGPDHFAFSRVYSEIALPLAVSMSQNQDVKNFL